MYHEGVLVGCGGQGEGVVLIFTLGQARDSNPLPRLVFELSRPLELYHSHIYNYND